MEAVIAAGEELLAILPSPPIASLDDRDDLQLPPSPPPALISSSIVDVTLTAAFRLGVQSAMLKEEYGQMLLRMMTIYATNDISSLPQRGTIYKRWEHATHDALTAAKMQAIVDTTDKMVQLEAELAKVMRLQILLQDLCNGPVIADASMANINPIALAQQLQEYAARPVKFVFVEPTEEQQQQPHYLKLRDIPAICELAAYCGVSLSELDTQEKLDKLLQALFGGSSEPRIVELTGAYPTLFALGTIGAAAFLLYTMVQLIYNKDPHWRSKLSTRGIGAIMLVCLALTNYLYANYEDVRDQVRSEDVFNATIVGRPGVNILSPQYDLPSTTQRENLDAFVDLLLNLLSDPQQGFMELMESMPALLRQEQQLMYATLRSTFTRPMSLHEQARQEGYEIPASQDFFAFNAYIQREYLRWFNPDVYRALYVDIPFVRDVSVEISNLWIFDRVRTLFWGTSLYDANISRIVRAISGVLAPLGSTAVQAAETTHTVATAVAPWATWLSGVSNEDGYVATVTVVMLTVATATAGIYTFISSHVSDAQKAIRWIVSNIHLSPSQERQVFAIASIEAMANQSVTTTVLETYNKFRMLRVQSEFLALGFAFASIPLSGYFAADYNFARIGAQLILTFMIKRITWLILRVPGADWIDGTDLAIFAALAADQTTTVIAIRGLSVLSGYLYESLVPDSNTLLIKQYFKKLRENAEFVGAASTEWTRILNDLQQVFLSDIGILVPPQKDFRELVRGAIKITDPQQMQISLQLAESIVDLQRKLKLLPGTRTRAIEGAMQWSKMILQTILDILEQRIDLADPSQLERRPEDRELVVYANAPQGLPPRIFILEGPLDTRRNVVTPWTGFANGLQVVLHTRQRSLLTDIVPYNFLVMVQNAARGLGVVDPTDPNQVFAFMRDIPTTVKLLFSTDAYSSELTAVLSNPKRFSPPARLEPSEAISEFPLYATMQLYANQSKLWVVDLIRMARQRHERNKSVFLLSYLPMADEKIALKYALQLPCVGLLMNHLLQMIRDLQQEGVATLSATSLPVREQEVLQFVILPILLGDPRTDVCCARVVYQPHPREE